MKIGQKVIVKETKQRGIIVSIVENKVTHIRDIENNELIDVRYQPIKPVNRVIDFLKNILKR